MVARDPHRFVNELDTAVGSASYFRSFAGTYVPYVMSSGLLSPEEPEAWLTAQRQAMETEHFSRHATITRNWRAAFSAAESKRDA